MLAAVLAFAVAGCGSADPRPTPSLGPPPVAVPTSLDCPPAADRGLPPGRVSGPGPLVPRGAISARLCSDTPTPAPDYRFSNVVLTRGVENLVERLNNLERYDPQRICPKDGGTGYVLVLGYPDGQRVEVLIGGGGCNDVRAGDQTRYDPRSTVITEFAKLAG